MSPKKTDDRTPHERIAAELRSSILSGDIEPGAQLPTTAQLMARFGVTNQTVQRAMGVLKSEGLVVGRSGSGVFVREDRQTLIAPEDYLEPAVPGEPHPWVTKARANGARGKSTLLEVAEVPAPLQVALAFGLAANGEVVLRKQLLSLDDEPVELVRNYFPVEIARGTALAERRPIRGGSPRVLADMGFHPREMVDHVSVRMPTTDEYIALDMKGSTPVLRTFRVVLTDDRRPIEATVLVKAGYLFELEYRVRQA